MFDRVRFARDATPLGLCSFLQLNPRVAARRGHPGLSCTTASRLEESSRVLKNSYSMSRATNLECADNGGALDFLAFSWSANPKRRRATLAAALQISFSAAC